jgi:hypothetical protein
VVALSVDNRIIVPVPIGRRQLGIECCVNDEVSFFNSIRIHRIKGLADHLVG